MQKNVLFERNALKLCIDCRYVVLARGAFVVLLYFENFVGDGRG